MPWDESSLYISHHTKGQWQTSCIKSGSSVVQPQSTPQGLVVMSDENGFISHMFAQRAVVVLTGA